MNKMPCNAKRCRAIVQIYGGADDTNIEFLNRLYGPYSSPQLRLPDQEDPKRVLLSGDKHARADDRED